jgi:Na+-transporting methylmalonyl-CoA/oxaloacetate decarboxylase gamma subunit
MIIDMALFFLVLFLLLPGMMIFSMLMRDHIAPHSRHDDEQKFEHAGYHNNK